MGVFSALLLGSVGAGLALQCRDPSQCATRENCTEAALLLRTGHTCRGFPYYMGKAPLTGAVEKKESRAHGECTRWEGGTCMVWATTGTTEGVPANTGTGRCLAANAHGRCERWSVAADVWAPCRPAEAPAGSPETGLECCAGDACRTRERTSWWQECRCTSGEAVCMEWTCREVADVEPGVLAGGRAWTHRCLATGLGGRVCVLWSGSTDSDAAEETFEMSTCTCAEIADAGASAVCLSWDCTADAVAMHSVDVAEVAAGVLLASMFGFITFVMPRIVQVLVQACAVTLPVLCRGGVVPALLTLSVQLVVLALQLAHSVSLEDADSAEAESGDEELILVKSSADNAL